MLKIGKHLVGPGQPTFIIAEIGINHNGSIDLAKTLIDIAVKYGCDAVKFQKRDLGRVYSSTDLMRERTTPFGNLNIDLKRRLEFDKSGYEEINNYCKEKGIIWFASAWDENSIRFLEELHVPVHKVASAITTNKYLLQKFKDTDKPLIMSTGMCSKQDILTALRITGRQNVALLQCTSTYPCEDNNINLRVIPELKKLVDVVGFSAHNKGVAPIVWAVLMGADIIEVHITIDRTMYGSDHAASLEPKGLEMLVRDIRKIPIVLGSGIKEILEPEIPILMKLRTMAVVPRTKGYRYFQDDPGNQGRGSGYYYHSVKHGKYYKNDSK